MTSKDKEEEVHVNTYSSIKPVGLFEIFKFSTPFDIFLVIVGLISAVIHGLGYPGLMLLLGDSSEDLGNLELRKIFIKFFLKGNGIRMYTDNENIPYWVIIRGIQRIFPYQWMDKAMASDIMTFYAIVMLAIVFFVFFFATIQSICLSAACENQTKRIRLGFLSSVMSKEIGWHDQHSSGMVINQLVEDINKISYGIGDKIAFLTQTMSTFIFSILLALFKSYKMTLITLVASPTVGITTFALGKIASTLSSREMLSYAKAGAVAEEVLGGIRTVVAFGGEEKEAERYRENLKESCKTGITRSTFNGAMMGIVWSSIYINCGIGYWYGGHLAVTDPNFHSSQVITAFFSVLNGAFMLGQGLPTIADFNNARTAATAIYEVIDHKSPIDSTDPSGVKPETFQGNVEFHDIFFHYPSRPDVKILKGFDLTVNAGETVALVGSSGCGKSSLIQLLQRFYDPVRGSINIDGKPLKSLNIKYWRENIGIVSQEPILFAATIEENIRKGNRECSHDDIVNACEMANAREFIEALPNRYDTLIGEKGAQLSGGQKQRIAIARALVRNPKILLLDEATSALDNESEAIVKEALDKAMKGRTTFVVAHRLTTIQNADQIVAIDKGKIKEKGTHDELMEKQGLYYSLVNNQLVHLKSKSESEETEDLVSKAVDRKYSRVSFSADTVYDKRQRRTTMASIYEASLAEKEEIPTYSFARIAKMNQPEYAYLFFGVISSIIVGCVNPIHGWNLSRFMTVLGDPDENYIRAESIKYVIITLILAGTMVVGNTAMSYSLAVAGERLTYRCRLLAFKAMLRQEIGWFDLPENNIGSLTTKLSNDISTIHGAVGNVMGSVFLSVGSLGFGIGIGLYYQWMLALIIIFFTPLIVLAGLFQVLAMTGSTTKDKIALEKAGKVAVEGVENMRTVAGLTLENEFIAHYERELYTASKKNSNTHFFHGLTLGFSQFTIFLLMAIIFYASGKIIDGGSGTMKDVFSVMFSLIISTMTLGQSFAFAPDIGKGLISTGYFFQLLDRHSKIDYTSTSGQSIRSSHLTGEVKSMGVSFRYPTRLSVPILRGLDLKAKPNTTIALVGGSGCGKSTIIQLLERFYDPLRGQIDIDSKNIKQLRLSNLRSCLSLVSQEPILFSTSILENIQYGDNTRRVSLNEVYQAAANANIHEFIQSLPDGYQTNVGERGSQLSGGQKQRIAIARALVRNPRILLLDEATSALDTESEKIVQEALDKARVNRTCIVIAHRLSTIKHADQIFVLKNGRVREAGTHDELVAQQGIYYDMLKIQSKEK